jgi:hypothetical protein
MKSSKRNGLYPVLAAAGWAVLLMGCRDSSTVSGPRGAQGPPATPTPAPEPGASLWELTDEVVGDSGPDFCIHTPKVGMTFQGTYTIFRQGNALSIVPEDIVDWNSYQATLQGSNFTASNPPLAENDCAHYLQSSSLSGSFSADLTRLTATETWSFQLDSGQVKTLTFRWSAVRR